MQEVEIVIQPNGCIIHGSHPLFQDITKNSQGQVETTISSLFALPLEVKRTIRWSHRCFSSGDLM